MTVTFFISGHGFGHASREVEIIQAFTELRPDARILIRSSVSPTLLSRTLRSPYELKPGPCDAGIVQTSSVAHDDEATTRVAVDFYRTFDDRVAAETERLRDSDVALVVGDIPPLAFEVAARLGIPGIAIANFTWDWIFEGHPGLAESAPWLIPRLRDAYRTATLALELPFAGGFGVFSRVRPIPLVARHHTRSREETRERFGIPPDRPAVLLSFGGYGLPALDLARVDVRSAWTIVTTDRTSGDVPPPPGVIFLSESEFIDTGFRYEDLVAAVDAVVSKPGFGIIAECIAAGTPLLYTSRGVFREYDLLVSEMPRFLRCQYIDQPALFAGTWSRALASLIGQPPAPEQMRTDGAHVAAAELSRVLDESRSG